MPHEHPGHSHPIFPSDGEGAEPTAARLTRTGTKIAFLDVSMGAPFWAHGRFWTRTDHVSATELHDTRKRGSSCDFTMDGTTKPAGGPYSHIDETCEEVEAVTMSLDTDLLALIKPLPADAMAALERSSRGIVMLDRDDPPAADHELVGFLAVWADRYQREWGLDGLHPTHYALMQKYGARMDDFKVATNAPGGAPVTPVATFSGRIAPLNGTKTHPLSDHAIAELRDLAMAPTPRQSMNPGVVDRLLRGGLARVVQMMSPFKVHRWADIDFLEITDAGRAAIAPKD